MTYLVPQAIEYGTFVCSLSLSGGSATIDPAQETVGWTKQGRLVHVFGQLRISAVSTPSGIITLECLPFENDLNYSEGAGDIQVPISVINTTGALVQVDIVNTSPGSQNVGMVEQNGVTVSITSLAPKFQINTLIALNFHYLTTS